MKRITTLLLILLAFTLSSTAQSTSPLPYCNAAFDDGGFGDVPDAIDLVSFGTLYNKTDSQYPFPHYVYYNNISAPTLNAGSTYTLKVVFSPQGSAGYGVWIDYNHNDLFDSLEWVAGTSGTTALQLTSDSVMININIPANAVAGQTRMRVRIVEDDNYHALHGYKELACNLDTTAVNTMDWGETEDYNLMIANATGISEITATSLASLYPNPANDVMTLSVPNYESGYTYSIINAIGQSLQENKIMSTSQKIDISSLGYGIYFMRVSDISSHTLAVLKFDKQ